MSESGLRTPQRVSRTVTVADFAAFELPAGSLCSVDGCGREATFTVQRKARGGRGAGGGRELLIRLGYCAEHYSMANRFNAQRYP